MQRLKIAIATLAALTAVVGGYASAEGEDVKPAPSTKAATFDDAIEQEGQNLTSEEKLESAQKRIERMRTVLTQTTDLLQKVREGDNDILRVNCINEKLAAVKGFVKVSEQSYTNLRDAAGREDDTAEMHHFSLISIGSQKVRDLGEEAQTCVGEVQMYADETVVDRHEDPGIADVDPIEIDDDAFEDRFATETLPELTPFQ